MSQVKWTRDQLRAIESRGSSILVSAAAGSGKTAVLVERLLRRIVDERLDITQFLIITYTKAAASELRRKISDALYERAAANPGDKHIRRQLALVGSARISTVHSFCTWVLRNFGDQEELPGGFRVLDENEGRFILEDILSELVDEKYDESEKSFLALADYLSGARNDKQLFSAVLELYDKSISHPYPEKWLCEVAESYDMSGKNNILDTRWGEYSFRTAREALENIVKTIDCMIRDAERSAVGSELYAELLDTERDSLNDAVCDDWDEMRKRLSGIEFLRLPSSKKLDDKALAERIKAGHARIKSDVAEVLEKFLPDSSDILLSELSELAPHIKELSSLVCELSARFKKEKLRRGVLDYSDLEHFAVALLVESYDAELDSVVPSAVANDVAKSFCEILLDEFQDSNNVQDIIFRAVSRNEKNIVMVGDVKQSIYRFRLADPSIFMKKYKSFKKYEDAMGDEPRCITLAQNFRSRAEVLDASNALFAEIMTEKLGGVDYTKEQYLIPREEIVDSEREDMACEFCLVDRKDSENCSAAEAEARMVSKKISELVNAGFEIYDKDKGRRRVEYRDFAILLRSVSGNAEVYERALAEYGIPYISPRAEGLLCKSEVSAIVSYLSVIDNPTSDIPLLAVLKSPLFAFSADDLCHIRRSGGDNLIYAMELLAKKSGETADKCRAFLTQLSELRACSRGMSAGSLIWEVYNRTNALGMFGALPYGEERQRNLVEFYKFADSLCNTGYNGLYRFISHIAQIAERGGDIPAPAAHTSNAVTIMTIHKSKGLEFPVVFLGGSIRNFNTDDIRRPVLIHPELGVGLRYRDESLGREVSTLARDVIAHAIVDEMKSEEMRILYVAMTRAREKLYIVASHNDAAKMIEKTYTENSYPELDEKTLASRMGTQMWFMLPILRSACGNGLLRYAGLPENENNQLGGILAHAEACPAENEKASVSDTVGDVQTDEFEAAREMLGFVYPYSSATETPSKVTATGIGAAKSTKQRYIRRSVPRPEFMREKSLTAAERGTALHMAMQFADFKKCNTLDGVKSELLRLGDEKYLTAKQLEAVDAEKIFGFITSDIGREVLGAEYVRREFKFSVLLPADEALGDKSLSGEKVLAQGVMDMYYETSEGISIVDFKTDKKRPSGDTLEKYSEQLRIYRRALYEMTGKQAKSLILYLVSLGEYIEI